MREAAVVQPLARSVKIRVVIALASVLVFNILTLPANHTEVQDSVHSIYGLTNGKLEEIYHPNHLLGNLISYMLWQGMQVLGYKGSVQVPMIMMNLVASLATLWIFSLLMARLGFPVYLQLLSLAAVAFSYAYWLHTVECEIYVLPLPFLMLSLHRLVAMSDDPRSWSHVLALALLLAVVVLFHQHHALFGVVVLIGFGVVFSTVRPRLSPGAILGRVVTFGFVSITIVIVTYYLIGKYAVGLSGPAEIMAWMQTTAATGKWGYWSILGSPKVLVGFSRAFVGGHFLFSLPFVAGLLQNLLPDYQMEEEIFMVQNLSKLVGLSLLVLSVVVAAAIIVLLTKIVRRRAVKTLFQSGYAVRLVLLVSLSYIGIYGTFITWWEPQNNELWTSVIPFVVLSIALLSKPLLGDVKVRYALGLIVSGLFVINLLGSIMPQQSRERDYWFQFNRWLIENAGPGDLIVSGAGYISDGYLLLYSGAAELGTWDEGARLEEKFAERVALLQPRRIFFSSTILTPPRGLVRRFNVDVSHAREFFNRRRQQLRLVHADEWQEVFLYSPAGSDH